jgi:hypothetical protein
MATKKTKKKVGKKTTHHRKRRMGAHGELADFAMRVLGVAGGAVAGAYLIPNLSTIQGLNSLPAWAIPSMVMAAGAGLPYIAPKTPILEDIGMGMLAIGAVETLNQTVLDIPGISGLAMSNNAPAGTTALSKAVGNKKVGSGPNSYLNRTVGMRRDSRLKAVGALISD